MKKYCIIASTLLAVALTACGDKKEQVYAVDAVQEAEAKAIANAPKAEPMKFDDEHLPPLTGTTTTTDSSTVTADTTATAPTDGQAAATTAEAAPTATSEATAETSKTETAPAEAPKQ